MLIDNFKIGEKTFVIAEIGNNHEGDFGRALKLVEEASHSGADAVKFQVFRPEALVSSDMPALAHVSARAPTQLERLKKIQLSFDQFRDLAVRAKSLGLRVMASVFDPECADAMAPVVSAFKIASTDLTNLPLVRHIASKGKPVIVSTGMANIEEIKQFAKEIPSERLALLHCVSSYPVPPEEANLLAIPYLQEIFPQIPIGYSDHTVGNLACLAAVALGAKIIEKHFTLDKTLPYGDHKLSADPADLKQLVEDIRRIEPMLGEYKKGLSPSEVAMRDRMRRGLYAARAIAKGERLSQDMVIALRPVAGIPVAAIDSILGRRLARDIALREAIKFEDLEPEGS